MILFCATRRFFSPRKITPSKSTFDLVFVRFKNDVRIWTGGRGLYKKKKYDAAEIILRLDIALHFLSEKAGLIFTSPAVYEEGLALHNLSSIENYNLKNVHLMVKYCSVVCFFVYSEAEYFFLWLLAPRVSLLVFVIGFSLKSILACKFIFSIAFSSLCPNDVYLNWDITISTFTFHCSIIVILSWGDPGLYMFWSSFHLYLSELQFVSYVCIIPMLFLLVPLVLFCFSRILPWFSS